MNNVLRFFAAPSEKINPGDIGVQPVKNADAAITSLLNTAYLWAGIICIIVIIIASYIYVTSAGNSSNTKLAKDAITYAIVGIVIVASAFGITQFVIGRF